MPQIALRVDDQQVVRLFQRAPAAITLRLRQLVEGGAIDVQREMRIAANVGVTGNLRRSVRYRFNPWKLEAVIEPAAQYAEPVEYGSRAHYVSVAEGTPLRAWAKLKGINPYALQASIAKKGTKPHPFVEPTYRKMKPKVEGDVIHGLSRLVEDMDNARI